MKYTWLLLIIMFSFLIGGQTEANNILTNIEKEPSGNSNSQVNPPLFVDAGPVQFICNGQSANLTALATGGTPPYSYLWSDGSTDQSTVVNPSLPTTYTITVTDAILTTASDQVFVIVNQSPQVYLGANQNVCEGAVVTLQENLSGSYLWSNGSTQNSIQVLTSGTYSLTITDNNGCSGSDEILITFNPLPNVNLGPDISISTGNSATLDAGAGYASYLWSTGMVTQTISVNTSGTYSVTVTDAFGCVGSDNIIVTVTTAVLSVDVGPDQTICDGDYATLTSTPSDGTPPYSYAWSSGQLTSTIIVSPSTTTTYSITVSDSNSTLATDNVTIIVNQSPFVDLGPDIVVCEGDIVPITSNGQGTFLWSNGSTTNSIVATTTGYYSLTVTGSNGCATNDNLLVTFNPPPVVDLGPNITIIIGDSTILDGGPSFSSYLWSDGSTTQTITVSTTGTYSVSVTDNAGCGNSSSVEVFAISSNTPGWSFTPTSSNHSILIPNFSTLTINGVQISIGDYIGVFFDSLGTLKCSGFIIWNGQMNGLAAWGEDSTNSNDGFAVGEEFKWKIWQASTNLEFEASATYMTGTSFPDQQYFNFNGTSGIESLIAPISLGQTINMPLGWSIFSTYIIPTDPNISDVMTPIVSAVELIKNGDGQVYWPAYFLNLIGNMVIGDGYQIKLTTAQTLLITGTAVIPEITPISIPAGWSIIGYLRQSPASIETMLLPFVADVELAKNGVGQVYWPAYFLNLIGTMNPGEGYQLKLSNANVLTYPPN